VLVAQQRFPLVNTLFRNVNRRFSRLAPINVEASLQNVNIKEAPLKGELHVLVTEKETDRGVPFAPIEIYVNGARVFLGRCNRSGKYVHPITLDGHRGIIDVFHGRKRLITASDSVSVLWDNFNDGVLDKKIWETFKGWPAYYVGKAEIREQDGVVKFVSTNTGYLAGIYTKDPVDISDGHIRAKLYTGGWVVCALTILPSTEPFYSAGYNRGYDVVVWQNGIDKFIVYSGTRTVYKKGTLRANPETVEVILEGNTIKFLEEGTEVYRETYKPASKLCNIYLWGQSWYHFRGGTSWADDLIMVSG